MASMASMASWTSPCVSASSAIFTQALLLEKNLRNGGISREMASSTFQTVSALLLLAAAASAPRRPGHPPRPLRLREPPRRRGRDAAGERRRAAVPRGAAVAAARAHARHPAVPPRDPRREEGRVDGRALLGRRDRVPARVARRGGKVPRVPARARGARRDPGEGGGSAAATASARRRRGTRSTARGCSRDAARAYGGCALGLGHTRVERGAHGPARATQPALLAPPATAGTPPTSAASRRTWAGRKRLVSLLRGNERA